MAYIIQNQDWKTISNVAKKYGYAMNEFGRIITRQANGDIRRKIRMNSTEYLIVSQKARQRGLPVSRYIEERCRSVASEYPNITSIDLKKYRREYGRTQEKIRNKIVTFQAVSGKQEQRLTAAGREYGLTYSEVVRAILFQNTEEVDGGKEA